MPNYLHVATGVQDSAFAWSIRAISTSSATESAAQTAWDAGFVALWNTASFLALVSTTTTLTQTSTSTANASFKQTTKTVSTHNIAGTGTGSLPFQICPIVTLRTNQATKYGHGRWYLPALVPASLATGGYVLSSAAVTAIVTAVNAGFTAWAGSLTFQILHRKGTLHGPGPLTLDAVISGDVSNKPGIQRRRGDKFVPSRTAITL
jgi:hypothetical protein